MKRIFFNFIYLFSIFSILLINQLTSEEKTFFWKVNTKEKVIFLTFDDGPGEYTEKVLEILEKYNIKATFFILGKLAKYRKNIIQKIFVQGHIVGSHTYSHKNFYKLSKNLSPQECNKILEEELIRTEKEIVSVLKEEKIKYVRLPNGFYHKWVDDVIKKYNYKVINWTYGCDWLDIEEEEMFQRYISALQPGGIYLFHDGGKNRTKTIKVLEKFIKFALSKEYKFDILDNWVE